MPKPSPNRTGSDIYVPCSGLLTAGDLARLLQVSRRTLWRLLAAGLLPRPIALSGRLRRWLRDDIEHWIETRKRIGIAPSRNLHEVTTRLPNETP